MIINTNKLIDTCSKILTALDSNVSNVVTETVQIKVFDNTMTLTVTNGDYVVSEKTLLNGVNDEFNAVVKANVFLKLICQTTTDTIEMKTENDVLIVKGNGTSKLPMVYSNDKLVEIPMIEINNETSNFEIPVEILHSIINTNGKEITKVNSVSKPVQRMFYIDKDGCITFTTGACVNNFTLEKDVKFLLNNKIVKLFKLFNEGKVKFTLGYDADNNGSIQAKARFENDTTVITTLLINDESMINSVPVTAIRNRATNQYSYSVVLDKNLLLQTLTRSLTIIENSSKFNKTFGKFTFTNDNLTVSDMEDQNYKETINYNNNVNNIDGSYVALVDLNDVKLTLENSNSEFITLNFGDHQAMVCVKNNVYNVIPEVRSV